ncbi:MAG: hypothetical protein V7L00_30685 [Nostoc sp.]
MRLPWSGCGMNGNEWVYAIAFLVPCHNHPSTAYDFQPGIIANIIYTIS